MQSHRITSTLLAAAVIATLSAAPANAGPISDLGPKLVPSQGTLLGIFAKKRQGRTHNQEIRHVESQIGRRFAIDHFYFHFGDRLDDPNVRATIQQGRIPLINWKPEGRTAIKWYSIATGKQNATLDRAAAQLKSLNAPVMLAFHHEPENDAGTYGTPGQFKAAFRHVASRLAARGATNVVFVCILEGFTYSGARGGPAAWYPATAADWAAADAYNWAPGRPGKSWRSFKEAFTPFYAWGSKQNVPLMVGEFGTQEKPGFPNAKADWFRAARATLSSWPKIRAVLYFNSDKEYPWWIDTSRQSLGAFRALGQDQHFRP